MILPTDHKPSSPRRGSVTVLVIVVLALLFIIGMGLLIMTRAERHRAVQHGVLREVHAVNDALQQSVIEQLREGAVGSDGIPYNRGWSGDDSFYEHYADFAGWASPGAP